MEKNKLVSIVIPCCNEEKNINRTFDGLLEIIRDHKYDFEIIAVNDGSKDNTWDVIQKYARTHPEIVGINHMRNYGQAAAYQSGFDTSKGDYVVTVSADLETPLENINKVIKYLDDGYDMVNTHRVGRWGGGSRKMKSGLANKILAKVSGVNVMDRGSGMKGIKRNIISNLRLYGDMHRFIPDYASAFGAKIIEFEVEFNDRDFGVSNYKGINRTIQVLLDISTLWFILYFAKKPFKAMPGRLFGFTGALVSGSGGLIAFYLLVLKIMGQDIGGRPLLMLSILMIVVGVQSMMMGMIGELLMRTYFESSDRKTYTIREIVR